MLATYVIENPAYINHNIGVPAAANANGASAGSKCRSCIRVVKRKFTKNKIARKWYGLLTAIFRLRSINKFAASSTTALTPNESSFQKPHRPQKLKALMLPYGYCVSVAMNLSTIKVGKFPLLNGTKRTIKTVATTKAYLKSLRKLHFLLSARASISGAATTACGLTATPRAKATAETGQICINIIATRVVKLVIMSTCPHKVEFAKTAGLNKNAAEAKKASFGFFLVMK